MLWSRLACPCSGGAWFKSRPGHGLCCLRFSRQAVAGAVSRLFGTRVLGRGLFDTRYSCNRNGAATLFPLRKQSSRVLRSLWRPRSESSFPARVGYAPGCCVSLSPLFLLAFIMQNTAVQFSLARTNDMYRFF